MAQRRMFSKDVVCNDHFLNLPFSTQSLYFQLGMAADDDGFVSSPQSIARMIGADANDLEKLCTAEFIIPFHSGVIVLRHWKVNNYVPCDRYHETQCQDEFAQLIVTPNKLYQMKNTVSDAICIQDVSGTDTQVRIGKVNTIYAHPAGTSEDDSPAKQECKPPQKNELPPLFPQFWAAYPRKVGKAKAVKAFRRLRVKEPLLETMLASIAKSKASASWQKENGQFIPHPATWLNGRRWEDEEPPTPKQEIPACWEEN